jgi:hypothetical protein
MAACPNCGADLPEGSVFCPGCGASLAHAQKQQLPHSVPAAAAPAPTPAPKKKLPILTIVIVAVALLAGLLLGFLFFGGRGGGNQTAEIAAPATPSTPEGTWTLTGSSREGRRPGSGILMLDEDGGGYFSYSIGWGTQNESHEFHAYKPLAWAENKILYHNEACSFTITGAIMTMEWDGETLYFERTGGVERNKPLKIGQYSLTEAKSAEIDVEKDTTEEWNGTSLQLIGDQFVILYIVNSESRSYSEAMLLNDYFFILADGDGAYAAYFLYTFDGTTLTLYYDETLLTFTYQG